MSTSYGRIPRSHSSSKQHNSASHAKATFRKNLKELVRDHLHTCIVLSSHDEPNVPDFITTTTTSPCEEDEPITNTTAEFSAASRRRRSRLMDRWAARQAREMVTTIERQTREAELVALSNAQPVSAIAPSFMREPSPARSETSIDVPNLHASSLVQMWREFEAAAPIRTSSIQSTISNQTNILSNPDENSVDSERYDMIVTPDESMTDGDFDVTRSSYRVLDGGGDSERGRVADMVRRLTSANRSQSSITSWSDEIEQDRGVIREVQCQEQSVSMCEQRGDNVVFPPPRLRGWEVGRDLIAYIVRERQRELNSLAAHRPVSQFSHRSRIQALLRFRFLRREPAVQDQQHPASTTIEEGHTQCGPSILLLRERSNHRGPHDSNAVPTTESSSNLSLQFQNNSLNSERSDLADEIMDGSCRYQEISGTNDMGTQSLLISLPSMSEELQEETQSSLISLPSMSEELHEEASMSSDHTWQERGVAVSNLDWQETANATASLPSWEGDVVMEEGDRNGQQASGGTWLSDDSHQGRSWASSQRQDMYHSWNESTSNTEEIRELLERRSVTTTLASDFRETMDRLFLSISQRQADQPIVDHSYAEEEEVPPDQLQDHEVGTTDLVVSTSLQLPMLSRPYERQRSWHYSSYTRRSTPDSPEMELICDLRGDMVKLHREMSELRKSIDSCVHMQVELQRSMKQGVSSSTSHSGGDSGQKLQSPKRVPMKKGSCCICYEMQVDSLLYRCGHMCTCFKCAHELQWSSGRCPICRAQIVDVVRAYPDP
ncbi:uncharacterized protein LOC131233783 [Magnolia sinica]|uniref:uncharacterized protein LOC131233783 n=1 Tax=Magnolia sinica TaxID=86752 RepID=UPI00265A6DAE|nr:uncharacterized protein LOC131233783 [Magnolia sinica]